MSQNNNGGPEPERDFAFETLVNAVFAAKHAANAAEAALRVYLERTMGDEMPATPKQRAVFMQRLDRAVRRKPAQTDDEPDEPARERGVKP